jgi:hypothetical protein
MIMIESNPRYFTAEPQSRPRESLLFNPVRGGIEQTISGLRQNKFPKDSRV